jgi:hypothetical protein
MGAVVSRDRVRPVVHVGGLELLVGSVFLLPTGGWFGVVLVFVHLDDSD